METSSGGSGPWGPRRSGTMAARRSVRKAFIEAVRMIRDGRAAVEQNAPLARRDTSRPERPRHHHGELLLPERIAVRPGPLSHDNIRAGIAQRAGPPGRVLEEEGLLRSGDEVRARDQVRQHGRRPVTPARRGTEDRTVDVRVPEP